MTEMKMLLPCPMCGDDDPEITGENGWVWIACTTGSDCAGRGPDSDDEASAIEAWNRRASPQAPAREGVEVVMAVLDHWFDGKMKIDRNSEMVAQLAALTSREEAPAEGAEDAVLADLFNRADRGVGLTPSEVRTLAKHLRGRTSEPEAPAEPWYGDRDPQEVDQAYGEYDGSSCGQCGRERVMVGGATGRRICEKCGTYQEVPAPASADKLPDDVRRLVLAARSVAFGLVTPGGAEILALDKASEAFADRVPWDDEPLAALNEGGKG